MAFPRFILLKPYDEGEGRYFACGGDYHSYDVKLESELGAFNPMAKIELQQSSTQTNNNNYFHLRVCGVNRYFGLRGVDGIAAQSNHPNEDLNDKSGCTLFEPRRADDHGNGNGNGSYYLIHVASGLHAQRDFKSVFMVARNITSYDDYRAAIFTFVDWKTMVKLPEHVAFKGSNGKYLQAKVLDGYNYLEFSSEDPYDKKSGFCVELRPDGYVRIKSDFYGEFWRCNVNNDPDWILADEKRGSAGDRLHDAFWPIRIDNTTIALRNGTNNNFCTNLDDYWKPNCLAASASTITKEARLAVEELVQERKIRDVMYRMEDARISDEKPYVGGTYTLKNTSDVEANMEFEMEYKNETAYSFSHGLSIKAGALTSIKANLAFIVESQIQICAEIEKSFEWGETTTDSITLKAKSSIHVPAVIHYAGTKGTCNIPFSYTREDTSATDGKIAYNVQIDGVYTGVSCYNFDFKIASIRKIQP